jgi:hypothetical protein
MSYNASQSTATFDARNAAFAFAFTFFSFSSQQGAGGAMV